MDGCLAGPTWLTSSLFVSSMALVIEVQRFRFMPRSLSIVGFGRSKMGDSQLREKLAKYLPGTDEEKSKFLQLVRDFGAFYLSN
jgi:hypothetical protein